MFCYGCDDTIMDVTMENDALKTHFFFYFKKTLFKQLNINISAMSTVKPSSKNFFILKHLHGIAQTGSVMHRCQVILAWLS